MNELIDNPIRDFDALKGAAMRHGATLAQFVRAVELVGESPKDVVACLVRQGFVNYSDTPRE
jgi:hypothetical protein